MQLDLFIHSREVILRNDALAAIQQGQVLAGRAALKALAAEYPGDAQLAALEILLQALESPPLCDPRADTVLAARARLETLVQPAAEKLMSTAQARAWLAAGWRNLAEDALELAYTPGSPLAHAASMYLRAGDWAAAEVAVLNIPSWRRIPQPLAWMAEARLAQAGLADAWPLLFELAWLDPAACDALIRRQTLPVLVRLLHDFDVEFENDTADAQDSQHHPCAWFPAWSLIVEPSLAPHLRESQAGTGEHPERVARLMLDILTMEKQGMQPSLLEARKQLRQFHPGLFKHYMRTR